MAYKAYVTRRQRAEEIKRKRRLAIIILSGCFIVFIIVMVCIFWNRAHGDAWEAQGEIILENTDAPYVEVNGNVPFFSSEEVTDSEFEIYSDLDELGRCGVACANISKETMPTEERGEIGNITPSGWHQEKYEGLVESNPPYLYNRCHLIAFCLAGENANERNLITGTRYMNVRGMLPFEEKVASYVVETGNHVLYRVTPDFQGNNLLASGVLMEAYSVEDDGAGICFCVYCYNVQPGVVIDYLTGESKRE